MYNSFFDTKIKEKRRKKQNFLTRTKQITMKTFMHQLPKQARTCATIAPVSAAMSWAFEGYNTPSIQGLDRGSPWGFIEGEKN